LTDEKDDSYTPPERKEKESMSEKKTDEGLLQTWAESQQKLLTDWLETLRRLGGTPTLGLWTKTIDA
jgi:hypothetical protein